MKRHNSHFPIRWRGFTLIEVILAVTIVALLASMAHFNHRNSSRKARESVLRHNLAQIRLTLDHYNNDKGRYPDSLEALLDEGYLRDIPEDPITRSRETWEQIYENDLSDEDSSYEPGVYDVKSGSAEQALDGTYYSEW